MAKWSSGSLVQKPWRQLYLTRLKFVGFSAFTWRGMSGREPSVRIGPPRWSIGFKAFRRGLDHGVSTIGGWNTFPAVEFSTPFPRNRPIVNTVMNAVLPGLRKSRRVDGLGGLVISGFRGKMLASLRAGSRWLIAEYNWGECFYLFIVCRRDRSSM